MAQTYTIQGTITKATVARSYVDALQVNSDTLRSNFSGAAFPDNPVEGQHCYRTDKALEYIYKSGGWTVNDDDTPTNTEVKAARGSLASLNTRLNVSMNADGTLKNPATATIDEWKDNALVVTYVSATSFSVPEDVTPIFTASRKIKVVLGTTTTITSVASSNYDSTNVKTVVTVNDAVLTSELSAVKYSIIQYGLPSGVASLDSPTFTGTPTAPTAAAATNTTQIATTEFVTTAMKNADSTMSIIAATPNYYARDALFTTAKTTLTTPSTLMVNINNVGYALRSSQTINLALTASWDSDSSTYATAANRAGRDFYIYACVPTSGTVPTIVLSANSTVPTGYTATNSRKIGGFHCLCADVGTISGHALSGYIAGDILPASAWDLSHRPKCDPEGMAYNAGTDMWNMIYLASWTGTTAANTLKLVSKYGAVTADGASAEKFHWYKFADTMSQQNMRHPWHREFMAYARGSNQGTNIKGSADINTTGGHVDTNGRRMISNDGLEDCCGFLLQWIEDTGSTSSGSWTGAYDANDFSDIRGLSCTTPYKGLAGGHWADSGHCGSRCSLWANGALDLCESIGARGASEPRKNVI